LHRHRRKSTQLPQFLMRARYNKIAVTQPRRISAMSLCRRVSYETLNEHGDEV
jgi:HrpA-like RNA helicase